MEVHVVHQNLGDLSIAVIDIRIEANGSPGGDHVAELCECLHDHDAVDRFEIFHDHLDWLPDDRSTSYRYEGSQTTPPNAETVTWSVLAEPKKDSKVDLKKLITQAELADQAARDLQPLERRYVAHYTHAEGAFGPEPTDKTAVKRSSKSWLMFRCENSEPLWKLSLSEVEVVTTWDRMTSPVRHHFLDELRRVRHSVQSGAESLESMVQFFERLGSFLYLEGTGLGE